MFRTISLILLTVVFTACAPSSATEPITLTAPPTVEVTQTPQAAFPPGWAGAITYPDNRIESIVVQFTETGGTLQIEPFAKAYQIKEIQRTDSLISFAVTTKSELRFSGEFDGSQIVGQVEGDGAASFTLLPLFSENSLIDFAGTYQFESGEALLINPAPEYSSSGLYFFGQGLMLTHFGTGAIRALYPVEQDAFLVGSARAIGYPFAEQINFTRGSDGNVTGLTWQSRDPQTGAPGEPEVATRLALQPEAVHFTSGDGTPLTGLLTLPATPGPYPAIMMLHGSEQGTKDNFGNQQMSAFMASHGIAILTYDKRGVGESGGHYSESATETNLNLTAQDAIAGVEYLKSRSEINGDKIGLIGFSQAGWVIPLAASQSKEISYFIILSGPVTSVGHENLYSSLTNNGQSATNYSQEELIDRIVSAPHSGFDSTPVIAELDQPGLWIFGDQDKSVFVLESTENLSNVIVGRKYNLSAYVFKNADHNLQHTTNGLFDEIPYSPGYHTDYHKTIAQWLEENVK